MNVEITHEDDFSIISDVAFNVVHRFTHEIRYIGAGWSIQEAQDNGPVIPVFKNEIRSTPQC